MSLLRIFGNNEPIIKGSNGSVDPKELAKTIEGAPHKEVPALTAVRSFKTNDGYNFDGLTQVYSGLNSEESQIAFLNALYQELGPNRIKVQTFLADLEFNHNASLPPKFRAQKPTMPVGGNPNDPLNPVARELIKGTWESSLKGRKAIAEYVEAEETYRKLVQEGAFEPVYEEKTITSCITGKKEHQKILNYEATEARKELKTLFEARIAYLKEKAYPFEGSPKVDISRMLLGRVAAAFYATAPAIDAALDFTPVISNVKSLIEAAWGKSLILGELSPEQRLTAVAFSLIPGGAVAKELKLGKLAPEIRKAASLTRSPVVRKAERHLLRNGIPFNEQKELYETYMTAVLANGLKRFSPEAERLQDFLFLRAQLGKASVEAGDILHGTSLDRALKIANNGLRPHQADFGFGIFGVKTPKAGRVEHVAGEARSYTQRGLSNALSGKAGTDPILLRISKKAQEEFGITTTPAKGALRDTVIIPKEVPVEAIEYYDPFEKVWKPLKSLRENLS